MPKPKMCKDCVAEHVASGEASWPAPRPTPWPGPRCTTHHREIVKIRKAQAHELGVGRKYGLKPGEYQRLYDFQDGKCAWCQLAMGKTSKLPVDHSHKTGRPRGLLCHACNQFLGFQ